MSFWWPDPGSCPVDDAPHTTCTSPDYPGGRKIVIPQLPMRDMATPGWSNNPTPTPVEAVPDVSFTTKTYRRGMLKRKP